MKKQRLVVLLAFTGLLGLAIIIGCTSLGEGFLLPGGEISLTPKFAFVSSGNYDCTDSNITISSFKVNASTGALTAAGTPVPTGDSTCGASFIDGDPTSAFVYVPLPGTSQVAVYSVNQDTGAMTAVTGSPFTAGSEPYVAKVHPSGKFLYVSNYGDDTVSVFSVGGNGALTAVGTAVPVSFSPMQIIMDPQGRFLFVTPGCCTTDSHVEAFAINSSTGALTAVAGSPFDVCNGEQCRSGVVDPTGKFLILGETWDSEVDVLSISAAGALTPVTGSPFASGSGPFNPVLATVGGNTYLSVNNLYDGTVSIYTFNTSTGSLTEVSGSPFSNTNWSWPHYQVVAGGFGYVVDTSKNAITAFQLNSSTGAPTEITGSPFGTTLVNPINMVITH